MNNTTASSRNNNNNNNKSSEFLQVGSGEDEMYTTLPLLWKAERLFPEAPRLASSQNQRVKTVKAKVVFQFIFIIVVCIWLLYQIRNSYNCDRIRSRITDEGDSQHEDTNIMKKSEYVVNRAEEEEFQTNETEISSFNDKNGIPEEVRNVEYTMTELDNELKISMYLETTLSSDGERVKASVAT